MNERLKEIESNHDMQIEEMKKTGFVMYSIHPHDTEWLIDTIKEQQAEIDSLSMAHDDMHRLLPKDKHFLIKSNINLNRKVQELSRVISCVASREVEIVEQNELYREVIEEIKKTSDDYRAGHFLDIQDSFFVDEIIAI